MLQRLDKLAPYALVLILGYLTYTAVIQAGSGLVDQKYLPEITSEMLAPVFIEPTAHASPIDRDPFEVEWSSYLKHDKEPPATTQPATTQPTTRPATTQPTTRPAEIPPPALPERLSAVFLGQEFHIAVIGQRIYKVGSTIGGSDPRKCWRIEAIADDHVVIGFGNIHRVLQVASDTANVGPAYRVKSGKDD